MESRCAKWFVASVVAFGVVACNTLFGDAVQCGADADCAHFGDGIVCGHQGTCVTSDVENEVASDAAPAVDAGSPAEAAATSGALVHLALSPTVGSAITGRTQLFTVTGLDDNNDPVSSVPMVTWTVSGGGTIAATGLFTAGNTAGGPFTVTASSGSVSATAAVTVTAQPVTTTTTKIGEVAILPVDDSGNGNLLLAQQATLAQTATIQSLSFYVTNAAGNLRLGVYDATGPNGGPGTKKAETAEFVAATGWNAVSVVAPTTLTAGDYWLAYAPSDNGLGFRRAGDGTGKFVVVSMPFGPMPSTFPDATTTGTDHWSFYATLTSP